MNFTVLPACLEFAAEEDLDLPPGGESNVFRGALGAALRRLCACEHCLNAGRTQTPDQCLYQRFFKPRWLEGPSGYRDAPRPFVLRSRLQPGLVRRGRVFCLELISFDVKVAWSSVEQAFALAAKRLNARLVRFEVADKVCLPLAGNADCGSLRLDFVTLTEIKEAGGVLEVPHFAPLIRRLAERIQALGRLYQNWPSDSNLTSLIAGAEDMRLTTWQWIHTENFRRRSSSGHVHPLGGFTGWAEYSGPVGAFLPLLQIGSWTGVGRQTVWGKGEIRVTALENVSCRSHRRSERYCR